MSDVAENLHVGPVDLRVIPRMRIARCWVQCAPDALWPTVEAVQRAAAETGVAVAGVPIVVFDGVALQPLVHAEIRVPVSDLAGPVAGTDSHPPIDFLRIDRERVACRTFSGRPGSALAAAVQDLFAWVDRSGLTRQGGLHHHVYMANTEARAITMEIRVPVQ